MTKFLLIKKMITNTWKLDEDNNFIQDPEKDAAKPKEDEDDDLEDGDEEVKDDDSAETTEGNLN